MGQKFTRASGALRLFTLLFAVACGTAAFGQTTTFTYQGRITDGSVSANGSYEVQFKLYDALSGGNQQPSAAPVTLTQTVQALSGVFTAQLDFGSAPFTGADVFLEIGVRHPGDAAFTTLVPRQKITSAPYAIKSLSSGTTDAVSSSAGGSVVTAINSSSSTIDAARLPGTLATQDGNNTFSGTNIFSTAPTFNAGLSAAGKQITSVATPVAGTDAATKAYVDSSAAAVTAGAVQLAPAAQQTATAARTLVNLKLIGARTLGFPGRDPLLSLSASGSYADGNNYDTERFRVENDGGLLSIGSFNSGASGNIPYEGSGTRFMWYPGKAAIRAGGIDGTQWDDANTGLYSTAFGENVRALGDNSFALGKSAVAAGSRTIAMGEGVTATGYASVALGYGASTSTSAGSPRLGTFVFSDFSVPLVYNFGSNVDSSTQFHPSVTNSFNVRAVNGSFFYTNTALTTGLIFNSSTANLTLTNGKLAMASDGSTTLYSNSSLTSGVTLPAGGGTWNSVSDRNMKSNIAAIDPRDILRRVLSLPIASWNYKTQNAAVRHIGPMAQDFYSTFKVGDSDKTISSIDPDGVALAAIQGLNEEIKDRDSRIDNLQQQLKNQQQQIDGLKALLCASHAKARICKARK